MKMVCGSAVNKQIYILFGLYGLLQIETELEIIWIHFQVTVTTTHELTIHVHLRIHLPQTKREVSFSVFCGSLKNIWPKKEIIQQTTATEMIRSQ
jgi:hypothetical protein